MNNLLYYEFPCKKQLLSLFMDQLLSYTVE